jgi:Integrase core domain/HTH-like domain
VLPFQLLIAVLGGWLHREQADVIAFLREENSTAEGQARRAAPAFRDGERRRLAELGHRLGRRLLAQVATLVTPDTILRWYRELVARKWTYRGGRGRSAGGPARLRALVIRMATENPTWGYPRIQGALKNLGHHVGHSTIARILCAEGIPPGGQRPMTWRTFVQAHWPALVAADFFTTEVWTARGLVTYYTAFVLDVQSRRVQVVGCTPYPDEPFVIQCLRQITRETGLLREGRILLCAGFEVERWGGAVAGLGGRPRGSDTPRAPNCNAYAERFVRSVKEECLNRVVPLGERHLRTTLHEFAAHYHHERNHQGLANELIEPPAVQRPTGAVRRR